MASVSHSAGRWPLIQQKLKDEFGESVFSSWLKQLIFVSAEGSTVTLGAPTRFMRDWVANHYGDRLSAIWREEISDLRRVDIVVATEAQADQGLSFLGAPNAGATEAVEKTVMDAPLATSDQHQILMDQPAAPLAADTRTGDNLTVGRGNRQANKVSAKSAKIPATVKSGDKAGESNHKNGDLNLNVTHILDRRYTFDNFVVGKPNELAYAAARRVDESPNVPFNPLFLYGGVGLGKTHLMHAIAWHIQETNPQRRVIYLSAEKFMYQFIRALRHKDTMAFKEQFRSVDVLMVDDLQFISGKESTQEEFFHTFNALVDQNRQIIISADKSPSDLEGIEERVRSRLGWGLVADIHPTDYELRLGILQSKADQLGMEIPNKVLEFLAHKIMSNVRELEGSLNRIVAHATLVGRPITLESTRDVLQDLIRANDKRIGVDDIQKAVADHFDVKLSDMVSARRARSIARPRQVAMYLSKTLTSASLPEIGRQFGGRDHTTVMYAVKKVTQLCAEDGAFAEDVDLLKRLLEA